MKYVTSFVEGFTNLFELGGENFVGWMTSIVPKVLMLLIAMNAIIALVGEERMNKLGELSAKNPVTRYLILPFLAAFMLGNPMAMSMGRFIPGKCNSAIRRMGFSRTSIQVSFSFGWGLRQVLKHWG